MSTRITLRTATGALALAFGAALVATGTAHAAVGAPSIQEGDSGFNAYCVQVGLLEAGDQSIGLDGDFGPQTEAGVLAFQRDQNLAQDGVVGPDTGSALWGWINFGAANNNFMTPWGVPISNCYQVLPTHT